MYVCILPYRGSSKYAQITNLNADCIIGFTIFHQIFLFDFLCLSRV